MHPAQDVRADLLKELRADAMNFNLHPPDAVLQTRTAGALAESPLSTRVTGT
jgi:hypothetical protein